MRFHVSLPIVLCAIASLLVGGEGATAATSHQVSAAVVSAAQHDDSPVANRGGIRPWPTRRITYSDETAKPRHVAMAIAQWNQATVGLRLVKAPRGRGMIRILSRQCPTRQTACAYYPQNGGDVYMGRLWAMRNSFSDAGAYDESQLPLLIHEIGHALGLAHRSGCTIMEPYLGNWSRNCSGLARPYGAGFAACAPQLADAQAVARLYRTQARPGTGRCQSPPAVGALLTGQTVLSEAAMDSTDAVTVRVANHSRIVWQQPYGSAVNIVATDSAGRTGRDFCGGWDRGPIESLERIVRPGAVATFRIPLCHYDGSNTYYFRTAFSSGLGSTRFGPQIFGVPITIDRAPSAWIDVGNIVETSATTRRYDFVAEVENDGPVTYSWNFGDPESSANTSSAVAPSHTYTTQGEKTVTLTVTDSLGQHYVATYNVDVWFE